MKKVIHIIALCVFFVMTSTPVFAQNYVFSTGEDTLPGFGKPTRYDMPVVPDPLSENIRRNKDAAHLPPPYFFGSGNIPTGPSSLYHDNLPGNSIAGASIQQQVNSFGHFPASTATEPSFYPDGSIGTLYIEKTGKTIKVFEGTHADNLKNGAGRFSMTSAWDGNIGVCGHNRGVNAHFGFVKDLRIGDRITYTTLFGSRTYEVFSVERIGEYDYSKLGWSSENLLTLITCVENTPESRWAAQLREVR